MDVENVADHPQQPDIVIDVHGDLLAVGGSADAPAFTPRSKSVRVLRARTWDPEHPHLTEAGAHSLIARGAVLVGIDSVNIDDTRTGERPAHTGLLSADVRIVEHLTGLDALPATGARFTAVPPAVQGLATFPVRAFAITQ